MSKNNKYNKLFYYQDVPIKLFYNQYLIIVKTVKYILQIQLSMQLSFQHVSQKQLDETFLQFLVWKINTDNTNKKYKFWKKRNG